MASVTANYSDITAFTSLGLGAVTGAVQDPEQRPLVNSVSHSDAPARSGGRWFTWQRCLKMVAYGFTFGGSIALKVHGLVSGNFSYPLDATANVLMGVGAVGLGREIKPVWTRNICNGLKRWTIPCFEIATTFYLNVNHTEARKQALYGTVSFLAGALPYDDFMHILSMEEKDLGPTQPRKVGLPLILEGDAASTKRRALVHALVLASGISLLNYSFYAQGKSLPDIIRDLGITGIGCAVGAHAAHHIYGIISRRVQAISQIDTTSVSDNSGKRDWLNSGLMIFQAAYPSLFAFSIIPNRWPGFLIGSAILGAGHEIALRNFQYMGPEIDDQNSRVGFFGRIKQLFWTSREVGDDEAPASLWGRVKYYGGKLKEHVLDTRVKDIALNAAFYGVLAWFVPWAIMQGGMPNRDIAGLTTLSGTALAGFIGPAIFDLLWNPSHSGVVNTLFFNTVAFNLWSVLYVLVQTKILASDTYLDNASIPGFVAGMSAEAFLGLAFGQERWTAMRLGRTNPALLDMLAKSLLWLTTYRYASGNTS